MNKIMAYLKHNNGRLPAFYKQFANEKEMNDYCKKYNYEKLTTEQLKKVTV